MDGRILRLRFSLCHFGRFVVRSFTYPRYPLDLQHLIVTVLIPLQEQPYLMPMPDFGALHQRPGTEAASSAA